VLTKEEAFRLNQGLVEREEYVADHSELTSPPRGAHKYAEVVTLPRVSPSQSEADASDHKDVPEAARVQAIRQTFGPLSPSDDALTMRR